MTFYHLSEVQNRKLNLVLQRLHAIGAPKAQQVIAIYGINWDNVSIWSVPTECLQNK